MKNNQILSIFIIVSFLLITQVHSLSGESKEYSMNDSKDRGYVNNSSNIANSWPKFGYDCRNSGYNPYASISPGNRLKWSIESSDRYYAIDNSGNIIHRNSEEKLESINSNNQSINWISDEGYRPYLPLISNDGSIVFIDTERYQKLVSLYPNGTRKWMSEIQATNSISPVEDYLGNIYYGDHGGALYSFSKNGELNWIYDTDVDLLNIVIDKNNTLYFSSYYHHLTESDYSLWSLYPNGTLKWRKTFSRSIGNPSLGDDETIYVCSDEGYIYAINKDNNTILWENEIEGDLAHYPAISKSGNIYTCTRFGALYSFDYEGNFNWKFNIISQYPSTIITDNNENIYFADDNVLYSLNKNGTINWKYIHDDLINYPSITNKGTVYFSTWEGLFAIGTVIPSGPRNISTEIGQNTCVLNWIKPSDDGGSEILGYRLYRSDHDNRTNISMLEDIGPERRNYTDEGVINGIQYSYFISSYNQEGESQLEGPFNLTPLGPSTPPLNISSEVGPGYISINWSKPFSNGGYPIESYAIFRDTGTGFQYHDYVEPFDFNYLDGSTIPDQEYSYYVIARTMAGNGEPSSIVSNKSLGAPPQPGIITVGQYIEAVRLSWDTNNEELLPYEVISVKIYQSGQGEIIVPFLNGSYNYTGLVNGQEYRFSISLVNIIGEGDWTDLIHATPGGPPTPPRNLTAWVNSTTVFLSWDPPENERGFPVDLYMVYYQRDDGNWSNLMSVTPDRPLHWNDTWVSKGIVRNYKVVAFNFRGRSIDSNVISVTVPLGDPPERPGMNDISYEYNRIEIIWTGQQNDSIEYSIYRSIGDTENFSLHATTNGLFYFETPSIDNITYYYYIIASNEYGDSPESDTISVFIEAHKGSDSRPKSNNSDDKGYPLIPIIIGVVVVLIIILALIIILIKRKKNPETSPPFEQEQQVDGIDQLMSSEELIPNGPDNVDGSIAPELSDQPFVKIPMEPVPVSSPIEPQESMIDDLFTPDEEGTIEE